MTFVLIVPVPHYENTPIQYTIFVEINNFQLKDFDIFLVFDQNVDCGNT